MHSAKQVKVGDGPSMSYHIMVEKLVKPFPKWGKQEVKEYPEDAAKVLKDYAEKLEVCHSAIGIHTEAGEVADVLKAFAIYGKDLDRTALVKELGDLRFWMQDIQNKFNISDHEIVQGNADKLAKRYKDMAYSDTQAIERKDKRFVVCEIKLSTLRDPGVQYLRALDGTWEHFYEAMRAKYSAYNTDPTFAVMVELDAGQYRFPTDEEKGI